MITVLCANDKSYYKQIPGLDVWDQHRDAYFFTGSNPVITHAPCPQWSRMKAFARHDESAKELAYFCLNKVVRNGGIFEHPAGSSFFKEAGIDKNLYSVDQSWWGFPARKTTYLYFSKCKPAPFPVFKNSPPSYVLGINSKLGQYQKALRKELPKSMWSTTMPDFAHWLIESINTHLNH